jgi:hypothetical protein
MKTLHPKYCRNRGPTLINAVPVNVKYYFTSPISRLYVQVNRRRVVGSVKALP